jgi:alkylated DNA repair dioxygenase AlkB
MNTTLRQSEAIRLEIDFLPDSQPLYLRLLRSIAWDERMQARKAASFGVPYNYSGICWPAIPFPDFLLPVLEQVIERVGYSPNNCLAHYYPDGGSSMGFHSDSTDELGPGTGIAIVSLGVERIITFRSQSDKKVREEYALPGGSLLFMTSEMQRDWKHAILPTDQSAGGRISLTFRQMRA